jgi:hypothetical protein
MQMSWLFAVFFDNEIALSDIVSASNNTDG